MGVGQASTLDGAVHAIVVRLQRAWIDEQLATRRTRTPSCRTHRHLDQLAVCCFHTERLGTVLGATTRTRTGLGPQLVLSCPTARPARHVSGTLAPCTRVHPREPRSKPSHDRLFFHRAPAHAALATCVDTAPPPLLVLAPIHRPFSAHATRSIGSVFPFPKGNSNPSQRDTFSQWSLRFNRETQPRTSLPRSTPLF